LNRASHEFLPSVMPTYSNYSTDFITYTH
jgi:hypothetical protein